MWSLETTIPAYGGGLDIPEVGLAVPAGIDPGDAHGRVVGWPARGAIE